MSSSIAFGVHDHAAQFKGVRGSFMVLSLLHEGAGREDGRERASGHATRRSLPQRRNEQETQKLLFLQ
jgi:hypothetical protein